MCGFESFLSLKFLFSFSIQIFAPIFEKVADFFLGWLKKFPDFKLVLIMIVVPIIFNIIQFWIQDNILKGKKENILKFIHSPYNERSHTPQIPPKLQVRESIFLKSQKEELNESVSEYCA